jgi:predicted alpha/beta hydrolase family esterase
MMTSETSGIEGEPIDLTNTSIRPQVRKFSKRLTLIASDNDRWLPRGVGIYQAPLGVEPVIYPGAGHFSLDDGWGQWPGLVRWINSGKDQDLLS